MDGGFRTWAVRQKESLKNREAQVPETGLNGNGLLYYLPIQWSVILDGFTMFCKKRIQGSWQKNWRVRKRNKCTRKNDSRIVVKVII